MKYRLSLLAEAVDDLRQVRLWYDEQREGLGREFSHHVRKCFELILANPNAYPKERGATRRALLRTFPYAVYYEIDGDRVVVMAVYHLKRRPGGWRKHGR